MIQQKYIIHLLCIFSITIYAIWYLGGYHHPRYLQLIYPFISIISGFCIVDILEKRNIWIKIISRIVVGTSLSAARSYAKEQEIALVEDIRSIVQDLQKFQKTKAIIEEDELRNKSES